MTQKLPTLQKPERFVSGSWCPGTFFFGHAFFGRVVGAFACDARQKVDERVPTHVPTLAVRLAGDLCLFLSALSCPVLYLCCFKQILCHQV